MSGSLVVGTRKGVFLFDLRGRGAWECTGGPFVPGIEVTHATVDPRTGWLYATANDPWFGPEVRISEDRGATWRSAKRSPRFPGDPMIEPGTATPWFMREQVVIERLWCIVPGLESEPGVLYCGVAPAALFRSADGGETWGEVTGLSGVPSKATWAPGAGGLALHSMALDPGRPGRAWVAISAGGVYGTKDGGASWAPMNEGIRDEDAAYDPKVELFPEAGQCVHRVERAAGDGGRLYAQAHLGTYRSDDGGAHWVDISAGLPSEFGLALAAHPTDPDCAYVVPLVGGDFRCPPGGRLAVWRTRDAGASWEACGEGLPASGAYMGVYRGALAAGGADGRSIAFGTATGQLYASEDDGDHWELITANLPPISSVVVS